MISQTLVIVLGLGLAGWGHLILHNLLGASEAWSRVDELFPPLFRSSPALAGRLLLVMGALLVVVAVAG